MFGSSIMDIAIGLVFVFLLLSLIASALNEMILSYLNMRGKELLRGLKTLLNDKTASGLVKQLYNHGQIFGLFEGEFDPSKKGNLPSYIPPRNFAFAFLDTVRNGRLSSELSKELRDKLRAVAQEARSMPANSGDAVALKAESATTENVAAILEQLKDDAAKLVRTAPELIHLVDAAIAESKVDPLRRAAPLIDDKVRLPLLAMINAADGEMSKLIEEVEAWYKSAMERVSGWYKYRTQWTNLILGAVLAVGLNVDTVVVARRLSNDSALRSSLVAAAQETAKQASPAPSASSNPPTPETPKKPDAGQQGTSPPKKSQPGSAKAGSTPQAGSNPPAPDPPQQQGSGEQGTSPPKESQGSGNQQQNPSAPAANIKAIEDQINRLQTLGLPIGWLDSSKLPIENSKPVDLDMRGFPKVGKWPDWLTSGIWKKWPPVVIFHFWGWLLTAVAVSLGAPFWFDLLNKFMVVRSTIKPGEKAPTKPSTGKKET